MFELYCPGFDATPQSVIGLFAGCVYSYQTLIAGLLAILAAYFAARPVWRQLKEINLQTRINQRETLANRLNEALDRFQRVENEMDETLDKLMQATLDPAGDRVEINAETAHFLHMKVSGKLNWYLETLRGTESHEVERAKAKLLQVRKELESTLDAAYWPDANDQSGEYYSLTDTEWQEVLDKAKHAKLDVSEKYADLSGAWRELREVQSKWVKEARLKIGSFDIAISGS